ncbi:Phosphatidylinositol 4,5-bisphosphate 3-kinase catalytic subunit alpha isoform [Halotydeus destructor]|nr:Phosphatidylinositol 4,5-bisphosphate 3-kinase catalytic subunit alpha isoform [Halotydeus destructor]
MLIAFECVMELKLDVRMAPATGSGELFGSHSNSKPEKFDIFMPNGLLLTHEFNRHDTLSKVKEDLWAKAKQEVCNRKLKTASSYVFHGVTRENGKTEFIDEHKPLNDLHLFKAVLALKEKGESSEEEDLKRIYANISAVIGKSLVELESSEDPEINECRKHFLQTALRLVTERVALEPLELAEYYYPSSRETYPKFSGTVNHPVEVIVYYAEDKSHSIPLNMDEIPSQAVETIFQQLNESCSISFGRKYRDFIHDDFVLKAYEYDDYFLTPCPLRNFKYVSRCISEKTKPEMFLVLKDFVEDKAIELKEQEANTFPMPSRVKLFKEPEATDRDSILWQHPGFFKIDVIAVSYLNVKDIEQIYVRAGIYHGLERLAECKTREVSPQDPQWRETLEFSVLYEDIPRSARLCLGVFAIHRVKKKLTHILEGYVNMPIFDYRNYLRTGRMSLSLWKPDKDDMDGLNPAGINGPNPDLDNMTSLDIQFSHRRSSVFYPLDDNIEEYLDHCFNREMEGKNSTPNSNESISLPEMELQLEDLLKPFAELTEAEKLSIWRRRDECRSSFPDSLPILLETFSWADKTTVCQLYGLLRGWHRVSTEVALELLDQRYADHRVRRYAVRCLNDLSDAKLAEYLLQLIHVAMKELYLHNPVTEFLLKRALRNRIVGHRFFWLLKAELKYSIATANINNIKRCELLLEAYMRGTDRQQLNMLERQSEAVDKLTEITVELNYMRDQGLKERLQHLKTILNEREDIRNVLCYFRSPLNFSLTYGELLIEKCRIMDSAKRPLWLQWSHKLKIGNVERKSEHGIIFKNGDDLRQDMLTLQVIKIMDSIWQSEGLDLKMMPYACLSTGNQIGMIEVVPQSKTVMHRQKELGFKASMQFGSRELHKWFELVSKKDPVKYDKMIELFTASCAGYCVATFVLGIGDRNPDNIMINEDGQIFHIDFGHFLGHFKRKYGYQRERVPFVLTDDFLFVICKGKELTLDALTPFIQTCEKAYLILRKHASLLITLFNLMSSTGIPELKTHEDSDYLRKTLQLSLNDEEASRYFKNKLDEARNNSFHTKIDWAFHNVKHRKT